MSRSIRREKQSAPPPDDTTGRPAPAARRQSGRQHPAQRDHTEDPKPKSRQTAKGPNPSAQAASCTSSETTPDWHVSPYCWAPSCSSTTAVATPSCRGQTVKKTKELQRENVGLPDTGADRRRGRGGAPASREEAERKNRAAGAAAEQSAEHPARTGTGEAGERTRPRSPGNGSEPHSDTTQTGGACRGQAVPRAREARPAAPSLAPRARAVGAGEGRIRGRSRTKTHTTAAGSQRREAASQRQSQGMQQHAPSAPDPDD